MERALCRGVLVAIVAGLLVTVGLAGPATAANSVVLRAQPSKPVVGQRTTLRATVRPVRAGRTVVFQRRSGTSWVTVGTATTNTRGIATRRTTFRKPGSVRLRAIARRHRGSAQRTDGLTLTVLKAPSTIGAAFPAGPWTAGATVRVPVTVSPAASGRSVHVARRTSDGWRRVSPVFKTGTTGRATIRWAPDAGTSGSYRATVSASATHRSASSTAITRTVASGGQRQDVDVPSRVMTGTVFDVAVTVTGPLTDATLTVTAPSAGDQVRTADDEVVIDPTTREGTVALGDVAAGERVSTLRWRAPGTVDSLPFTATLTAEGASEEASRTVEVVAEPAGGEQFDDSLMAVALGRDAPTSVDQLGFTYCSSVPAVAIPSYSDAVAAAQAYLADAIDPSYADEWEAMLARTPVEGLDAVVLNAVMDQRPAAALAASLHAHQLQPDDGSHLSDAAGAASMLGRPEWAVAFATAAGTLPVGASVGIRQETARLVNLGHAHAMMKQWEPATKALRLAVGTDPDAMAAQRELATVLRCQARKDEAFPHVRRGMRVVDQPDPVEDPDHFGSAGYTRLPTSDLYPLTGGSAGTLVTPVLPGTVGRFAGLGPATYGGSGYYRTEYDAVRVQSQALTDERNAAEADLATVRQGQDQVQIDHTRDLLRRMSWHAQPELKAAHEELSDAQSALWSPNNCDGEYPQHVFCAPDPSYSPCEHTREIYHEYALRMSRYLDAAEAYHALASPHLSAIQAQLSEPVAHRLAGLGARSGFTQTNQNALGNLSAASQRLAMANDWGVEDLSDGTKRYCDSPDVAPLPEDADPKVEQPEAPFCQKDSPESRVSLTAELEALTIEVSCEKWSAEVAGGPAPFLKAFGKYEMEFSNSGSTVNIGVKADLTGVGSFESAFYLERKSDGTVKDFGWQVGPEVKVGKYVNLKKYDDKIKFSFMAIYVN